MKKILNNILHRIKEDSLSRRKEGMERTVEYKGLKEIKTCLVLWTVDPKEGDWLKSLSEHLKGVKIEKVCFVPENVRILETDEMVTFRNGDLGFGGKVQNSALLAIMKKKFDLLIDLTLESNALINYVLTNTQALCIAGMKKEGGKGDVIVDGVGEPLVFIEKLTGLLAEINKY